MYENEKENKSDSHIDISISYKVICSFDELTTHDCKWLTSIHVPFLFMKKRLPLWMPFFSIYEYGVIKYIFTFGLIECSMCMYSDNWCWVFHHVGNVQFWPKYIAIWIFGSSQTFIIWPSKKIKKKVVILFSLLIIFDFTYTPHSIFEYRVRVCYSVLEDEYKYDNTLLGPQVPSNRLILSSQKSNNVNLLGIQWSNEKWEWNQVLLEMKIKSL